MMFASPLIVAQNVLGSRCPQTIMFCFSHAIVYLIIMYELLDWSSLLKQQWPQ